MHPFSRNRNRAWQQRQSTPKVVQIPVHFINSKPVDRSGSALKIQKLFRGFLVRKSMNRIKNVKNQVDEIEEKISKPDTIELIRKNDKERLRFSEGLMSLLIKLDSIRGFDFGVRECRKAVIRKAIALQERVDGLVEKVESLDKGSENDENLVEKVESLETNCLDGSENGEKIESLDTHCENDEKLGEFVEKVESLEANCLDVSENGEKIESLDAHCGNDGKLIECVEILDDDCGGEMENERIVDVGVDSEIKVSEENNGMKKNESLESGNGNNELMDRMVQDNEKMMNMMKMLFESNEKQMKMINGLSHRVEMLEKALVCDRRKKKKQQKKNKAASCGDE